MKKYIIRTILILSFVTLYSCQKNEISLPIGYEYLPSSINIEVLHYKWPYLYAAGGGYKYGAVFRRHIDSAEWKQIHYTAQKINDIADFGDQLLFIGDSVFVAGHSAAANSWSEPYYYPYFEPYPKTISNFKKILNTARGTIIISELNQIAGNIYYSPDTCQILYMKLQEDNGLYDITLIDSNSVMICGYGQVFTVNLTDWAMSRCNISGQIFTSIRYMDGAALLCSFSGSIYRSTDKGQSWETTYSHGKLKSKIRLNEVYFADKQYAFAIGEQGAILMSQDAGQNWDIIKNSNNEKLLSIVAVQDRIFIGGDSGKILILEHSAHH